MRYVLFCFSNALLSPTVFLRWLKNGDIIFELIAFDYDLDYVHAVWFYELVVTSGLCLHGMII
jgi:hypothetical protein